MTKQLKNIFSWEKWIPIIFAIVINIVVIVRAFDGVKTSVDLLSQKLDVFNERLQSDETRIQSTLVSLNKVESHVCQLDTAHGVTCINGGN